MGGVVATCSSVYSTGYAYTPAGASLFSFASAAPELRHPIDFAFDSAGNIYVSDVNLSTSRYPVHKFSPSGEHLAGIGIPGNGSADGRCNMPIGIVFDEDDNLYIVDCVNSRIQKWKADGTFLAKWGSSGAGDGQFNFAGGNAYCYIAYDGTYFYVGDAGNRRVQKFTKSGVYVGQWGSSGSGPGQFTTLNGIAVAPDGTIYVVDDYHNPGTGGTRSRIQHFSPSGTFLDQYLSPAYSNADGNFEHPNDIAIDGDGFIYVVDEYNARIQKLQLPGFTFVAKWSIPPDLGANPQGIAVRTQGPVTSFEFLRFDH